MSRPHPPRLARALLRAVAAGSDRAFLIADLDEEFQDVAAAEGPARAQRWYREQVFRSIPALVWSRIDPHVAWPTLSGGAYDVGLAVRALVRRPAFLAAVVLTLALGIGATTAVFTLIDAVLLHPLAVRQPESLVALFNASVATAPRDGVPYPTFRDLAGATTTLQDLAAYMTRDMAVRVDGRAEQIAGSVVSGNYFTLLGVQPQIGRLLGADDDRADASSPVVVLSDRYWRRAFNRAPDIVGRAIQVGPTPLTIIGVTPAGFRGVTLAGSPDLFIPVTMIRSLGMGGLFSGPFSQTILTTFRGYGWLQLVGRVRDGVSRTAVAAELTTLFEHVRSTSPPAPTGGPARTGAARMDVLPLGVAAATADRATVVRFAALLATTVALVLLLGCVNVGTMLFVRGLERRRELGVHAVLGASRSRLFGRLFLESLLLSAGGGFAGIALAAVVIKLLGAYSLPGGIAIDQLDLSLNGRVFAFALALSAGTTAIFGVLPAVRASRPDPAGIFRMNVRMATGGGPRGGLITLQVAIALVILVAAGLFERSLRIGLRTDIGFDPAPLVALTIQPGVQGYAGSRLSVLYRQIADRVAVQPGVEAAALTSHVPLSSNIAFPMRAMGPGAVEAPPWPAVRQTYVSPGYFATMGVSFVSGRDFTPADRAQTEAVAILNESAARALWPGVDPIGRTVLDSVDRPYRVVGLVRDTKYESLLDRGLGYAYFPLFQEPVSRVSLVARGGRPEVTLAIIQRVVSDVDATLPILTPRLVADQVDALLMTQRFGTTLLSLFGVIALCIAVVGIHAVLAFAVTQRRSEIGIRVALGAQRGDVLRAILVRTATAVGVGVALGLTTAALTAHTIEHLLFGIPPLDFASFAGATAIFAVAVVLVALQPARRATRIDPIEAMRD